MILKQFTSVLVFLSFSFIGLSQCADIKTSSDTAYCYSETAINLSQRLIVSNNDMTLSSNISGLITKSNNVWWLNSKLLKGQSYDSLNVKVFKEYLDTTKNCFSKDSITIQVRFVDLRIKTNAICYNFGALNITADWFFKNYNIIFKTNIPGLIEKRGSTWWFNTHLLTNDNHQVKIYKTDTTKFGCVGFDSFYLNIHSSPKVNLADVTRCQDYGDIELSAPGEKIVVLPNASNLSGGFRTWTYLNGTPPTGMLRNDGSIFDAKWVFNTLPGNVSAAGKHRLELKFESITTGCIGYDTMTLDVVPVPNVQFTPLPQQCSNWDTMNLNNYVNLSDGTWEVVEVDNKRPTTIGEYANYVIDEHKFDPSIGTKPFNTYLLRYDHTTSGCPTRDSISLIINGAPRIEPPVLDTVCNTLSSVSLEAKIDGVSNQPGVVWSGTHVTGSQFNPTNVESDTAQDFSGPYPIKLHYTKPSTGCSDTVYTEITVQAHPTIEITSLNDSFGLIYGKPVFLNAESTHDNGILWTSSGDGNILNSSSPNTEYTQGTSDKSNLSFTIYAETVPYGTACPVAKDSVKMSIYALGFKDKSLQPLKVYPTPTASNLSIVLPQSAQNGTIKVIDINGKVVQTIEIEHFSSLFTVDLSRIPNGIYFIKLNTSDGDYIEKIMKIAN